jgi:ribosomal RNA-processing protein 36
MLWTRPREVSAKVRVSKRDAMMDTSLYHITEQSSMKTRDPRFDDISGDFNQVQFDKAFGFLDDFRVRERDAVQSELDRLKKKGKNGKEETILSLQRELSVLESEISRSKRRKRMQEIRSDHRKKELELVREKGKVPYHLKESVLKKMVDKEELQSLKGTKKFRKRLDRKKKKRIAKEERPMPFFQEDL